MRGAEVASIATRIRHRARESGGFTLIELLMAASLSLLVIGGSVGILTTGLRSEPRIAERTADIQAARVSMEKLTRELREGSLITTATSNQLSLVTHVNSGTCGEGASTEVPICQVTYLCSASECTRSETNPDGGAASTETIVRGISTASVFTYSPSSSAPTYVGVKLEFPAASGDDSITLTDGVSMRNATDAAS